MELIKEDKVSMCISLIILVILIGLICHSCVEAIVETVENDEQEARRKIFVEQTYQRPAAYRQASPTQAEMDHLHHILLVMEVNR